VIAVFIFRIGSFGIVGMVFITGGITRRRIRAEEFIPQFESNVLIHRAGVRLLLLHAQFGQHFDDNAGFDLKLPSQLVDSDLFHR